MTHERDIAAILSARIEEHRLGVLCGAGTTSAARDTRMTVDDLMDAAARLAHLPKPCIAIVCWPQLVREMEAMGGGYPPSSLCPTLYGLPVYVKTDQPEPWKAFYDHDELRAYLKETP